MAALLRPVIPRLGASAATLTLPGRRQFFSPSLTIRNARLFRLDPIILNARPLQYFQTLRSVRTVKVRQIPRSARTYSSGRPNPDPTPNLGSPPAKLSLSQRLKNLSKEYGWYAVGVYLALSVLDFPFCFLAVRLIGPERIGHYEQLVLDKFWQLMPFERPWKKEDESMVLGLPDSSEREGIPVVEDVSHKNEEGESATIWTQLVLAYAVHKSLMPLRIPVTAAILPKVVKTLRKWGWASPKPKPA